MYRSLLKILYMNRNLFLQCNCWPAVSPAGGGTQYLRSCGFKTEELSTACAVGSHGAAFVSREVLVLQVREAFLGESRREPDEVLLQMRLELSETKGLFSIPR